MIYGGKELNAFIHITFPPALNNSSRLLTLQHSSHTHRYTHPEREREGERNMTKEEESEDGDADSTSVEKA